VLPGVSVIAGENVAWSTVGFVAELLMPAGTARVAVPSTVPSNVFDLM
jgi:hypothetical protein